MRTTIEQVREIAGVTGGIFVRKIMMQDLAADLNDAVELLAERINDTGGQDPEYIVWRDRVETFLAEPKEVQP